MFIKLKLVGGGALFIALLLFIGSQWLGSAAATQKRIILAPTRRNEPIAIIGVDLGSKRVQEGLFIRAGGPAPTTPFDADDNWVQNLTLYILNRTDKEVLSAGVLLTFPETQRETQAGLVSALWELRLGQTFFDLKGSPVQRKGVPMSFPAGRLLAIHLTDHIEEIKARVQLPSVLPLAAMTELTVSITPPVYFADGTMWNGASYFKFSRQTEAWEQEEVNYFPGSINRYWPGRPGWQEVTGGGRQ